MRGVGFCIPCERNSDSHDSRGTACSLHGATKEAREGTGDIVRRDARGAFEFDNATSCPGLLQKLGGEVADVGRSDHGNGPVERLQKARNHAFVLRRRNVP